MNQKILDALLKLDINNDDHWTADGLPRMDAIELIVGSKDITRQQVTAAKPGFSRAVAAASQVTQAQGAQGSTEPASQTAPAAAQAPSTNALVITTSEKEDKIEVDNTDEPDVAEARTQLLEAQEALAKLDQERAEVKRLYDEKSAEVDKLTDALEALVGKETVGDAIQGYLARQRQNLQERADRIQLIRESGVNLAELGRNLKAPIDAAMARKTGYGGGRPGSK